MRRARKLLTIVSAIALGSLVIVWPISYNLTLSGADEHGALTARNSIPIFPGYRSGFYDGKMWFYTYEIPYGGSMIGGRATKTGFDFPGIYYRHILTGYPGPAWITLAVSLCCPVFVFAILPVYWVIHRRDSSSKAEEPKA